VWSDEEDDADQAPRPAAVTGFAALSGAEQHLLLCPDVLQRLLLGMDSQRI
jgi:hypothetical protein